MSPQRLFFLNQVYEKENTRAQRILNGAKNYTDSEAAEIIDELCEYIIELIHDIERAQKPKRR